MKTTYTTAARVLALIFFLLSSIAFAGPGHDHGNTATPITGNALPRFAAVSEQLELVGIINGNQVTPYLDRFADNTPVNDAQIDMEIAGTKYKAKKVAAGEYEISLNDAIKPGVLAITATISAGELNDLLTTELDAHEDEGKLKSQFSWKSMAVWSAGTLIVVMGLIAFLRRRQIQRG